MGNFGRKFTESAKKDKPIQLVKLWVTVFNLLFVRWRKGFPQIDFFGQRLLVASYTSRDREFDSFRPRRKVSSKLGNAGCLGVFDVVLHIYFARNPWLVELLSKYRPTISPRSLMPLTSVAVTPENGTSIPLNVPPWRKKPWRTPPLSV